MNEREQQKMEFVGPLARAIRDKALADDATPTDRLAAAVMLLARQIDGTGLLLTTPMIVQGGGIGPHGIGGLG